MRTFYCPLRKICSFLLPCSESLRSLLFSSVNLSCKTRIISAFSMCIYQWNTQLLSDKIFSCTALFSSLSHCYWTIITSFRSFIYSCCFLIWLFSDMDSAEISLVWHLGLRPVTLLKKRLRCQCFLVNFVKLLRTAFFIEHLWWLLLNFQVLTKAFPLLALPWLYLLWFYWGQWFL